ncbi:N-acetylglucosamine-6-phosphate deacetylase [Marininema halotolerans]|uniref:N-acetylglucosamine-6-phosphate deacetylase n=1 Tax=Marininema halotolerans TaxID=1155944 RepID=A0A1I6SVV4_9BACL|nr:N-acetylglucosamine-6-phosphate deacetylase [Marininema halotolerans]SFS81030.1 N-acetylglucosamine-6-phosphate deacetylase [Marininema halotolerans]
MTQHEERFLLRDVTVYTEYEAISDGFLIVENGMIKRVGRIEELEREGGIRTLSLPGCYLTPGMIDIHIHGAEGADIMDGTLDALTTIAKALPREGTTSFLATTLTQSVDRISQAISNVTSYQQMQPKKGYAEVLGIHLEGPFIAWKRRGAQPIDYIQLPDLQQFNHWQSLAKGSIRIVTLAPEIEGGFNLVKSLKQRGVIVSIGHSDATFSEVEQAIKLGASHITHLYNGMRGLHHREPGVVGAALLHKELMVEVIPDGIHSLPEMVKLALQMKTARGIILITDGMRAKCLPDGTYELGGQTVNVTDRCATLSDGTLAGSVLTMDDGATNMLRYTGCTLLDIVHMTAVNPAKQLGVFHRKGSLASGKDADLNVYNEEGERIATFCKGSLSFARNGGAFSSWKC